MLDHYTQNVKDLLSSREVENIFENSEYICMLNQAAGDREILADHLGISPHQLRFVTRVGEGQGLIFYGSLILPFVDHFPKDTQMYQIMTTKLSETVVKKPAAIEAKDEPAEKPKKRRGRPPKKKVEEEVKETPLEEVKATTESEAEATPEPPRKRRGRPPKKKESEIVIEPMEEENEDE